MSVTTVNAFAVAALEREMRHRLFQVREPERLLVGLTRTQVHRFFPRFAARFPLEVKRGGRTIDLRSRVELWPLSLTNGRGA